MLFFLEIVMWPGRYAHRQFHFVTLIGLKALFAVFFYPSKFSYGKSDRWMMNDHDMLLLKHRRTLTLSSNGTDRKIPREIPNNFETLLLKAPFGGCLACKSCSACSLSFINLNPYIKLKLIELAFKRYQGIWNKMNCRTFYDL